MPSPADRFRPAVGRAPYRRPTWKTGIACWLIVACAHTATGQHAKTWYTEDELKLLTPMSPNPYLAYLPADVEPDWDYWNAYMRIQAAKRAAQSPQTVTKILNVPESESNDTQATANFITNFGTGAGDDPQADVTGSYPAPPAPGVAGPFAEDEGSIPLASTIALTPGNAVTISAEIGDGPHGSSGDLTGDLDFYELENLTQGQIILADIDGSATLDSFVSVWNAAGDLLAYNDDEEPFILIDSLLDFTVPENGTYYVCVGTFLSPFPLDPFDSGSGLGVGSEGPYDITLGLNYGDFDYFSMDLEAGDVLGASFSGDGMYLRLFDPAGDELIGSNQDVTAIYPATSPLPGGGVGVLAWVAEETGTYAVLMNKAQVGSYTLQLRVFRPNLESAGSADRQILFLDFDGATVDTSIFGFPGNATLSPFSAFVSGWGFGPAMVDPLIDAITAVVEENIRDDIRFPGGNNPSFDIEIRNSKDHADPFGQPNVSRVIIGGSIAEAGISTIGIAESIDPGNFEHEETALVLLDNLSDPDVFNFNSLNSFGVDPGSSVLELVATGVGNIAAHEAGHYFGNFHTENFASIPRIMDAGGNLANTVGVGDDFIYGNLDDTDVDFGPDFYHPDEGFLGIENTLNVVAFGLATGLNADEIYVDFTASENGTGVLSFPFDNLTDAATVANPTATVRIFAGTSSETFTGAGRLDKAMRLEKTGGGGSVRIGEP